MIEIQNLHFHYPGGPLVLKQINFRLEAGNLLAILGNNGAGKSTMLKCFNRIIAPDCGSILLNGEEILKMPIREVARKIAFVSQTIPAAQMTVHDMVMLGRRPYMKWGFTESDYHIVHDAMKQLGVLNLKERFLTELSGGERQKVMLARAIAQQPKLLLLDEPTSNLDLKNQYQVLQIAQNICHNMNISVIIVIHDLNLALRFCDRFLLMQNGEIFRYGNADIINRATIWNVYGVHGEVTKVNGQKIILVD